MQEAVWLMAWDRRRTRMSPGDTPRSIDAAMALCDHQPDVKLSMTLGLTVGVTAAVVVSCASAAYVYSRQHFRTLLENARASALAQGELIRVALEHQMIENDR